MKRLLIILILLLLPVSGWGTTYYVSSAGSNSSPYDTWEKAANSIGTITALSLSGTNVIYVAPGTYSTYLVLNDTKYANLSIIGTELGASESTYPNGIESVRDTVIWDSDSSSHVIYCGTANIDYVTIKNMSIKAKGTTGATKNGVWHGSTGNGWTFENVRFYADTTDITGGTLLRIDGGTGHKIVRCLFTANNYNSGKYGIDLEGASGGTIAFNIFSPWNGTHGLCERSILQHSSGTWNIYNNLISGSYNSAFLQNGSGTSNIKNNVIIASNGSQAGIYQISGTVNTENNLLYSAVHSPSTWTTGTINSSNDLSAPDYPKLINQSSSRGYLVVCVDDNAGLSYVQALEPLLANYGMSGTWYVNPYTVDPGDYAAMRTIVSNGTIEIGSHGGYHTDLIYDHVLNFSQSGGDNCTVAFDGSTITCNCDGTDYDTALDTTNASYDTVGEIITALNGTSGWTVAKSTTDDQLGTQISSDLPATTFASMGATAVPCDIDVSNAVSDCSEGGCSPFYLTNIYNAKDFLADTIINGGGNVTDPQTGTTYVTNSYAAAYNDLDAAAQEAIRTSDFTSARCILGAVHATGSYTYMYGHYSVNASHLVGSTEAETRTRARSVAVAASSFCRPVYVLAHNDTECSTSNDNGWKAILNEWSLTGIALVVSSQQVAGIYRNAPWTYTDGTGVSTRTYGDVSFHIQATSPCINAGTSPFSDGDGDQYDYAGNLIWSDTTDGTIGAWSDGVEIGPYGWFGGILLH